MCQWKFLVFRYRANTSARMAFMAPAMSLVAEGVRSVGVANGASRSRRSCEVFVELFLLILFFPLSGLFLFWFGYCSRIGSRVLSQCVSLSPYAAVSVLIDG